MATGMSMQMVDRPSGQATRRAEAASMDTPPKDAASKDAAPVDTTPAGTAPVDTTPAGTAPVDTTHGTQSCAYPQAGTVAPQDHPCRGLI